MVLPRSAAGRSSTKGTCRWGGGPQITRPDGGAGERGVPQVHRKASGAQRTARQTRHPGTLRAPPCLPALGLLRNTSAPSALPTSTALPQTPAGKTNRLEGVSLHSARGKCPPAIRVLVQTPKVPEAYGFLIIIQYGVFKNGQRIKWLKLKMTIWWFWTFFFWNVDKISEAYLYSVWGKL